MHEERGASSIEYGLLAALIAVASVQALSSLGGAVTGTFQTVEEGLEGRASNSTPPNGPTPGGFTSFESPPANSVAG